MAAAAAAGEAGGLLTYLKGGTVNRRRGPAALLAVALLLLVLLFGYAAVVSNYYLWATNFAGKGNHQGKGAVIGEELAARVAREEIKPEVLAAEIRRQLADELQRMRQQGSEEVENTAKERRDAEARIREQLMQFTKEVAETLRAQQERQQQQLQQLLEKQQQAQQQTQQQAQQAQEQQQQQQQPQQVPPSPYITHNFSCGYVSNSRWTRRFCFDALPRDITPTLEITTSAPAPISLTLRVHKMPKGDPTQTWTPACNDSLHVRFASSVVLSPSFLAATDVVEEECGVYRLVVHPPPDEVILKVLVFLLHIDGEGYANPSLDIPYGYNILGDPVKANLGASVYNVDANIQGEIRVPAMKQGSRDERAYRKCDGGDAPGYWRLAPDPLNPPYIGEPITWSPHGCHYRLYSSDALHNCLIQKNRTVVFAGESITRQLYNLFMSHANGMHYEDMEKHPHGGYYWPPVDILYEHSGGLNLQTDKLVQLCEHHGLGNLVPGLSSWFTQQQSHASPNSSISPNFLIVGVGHNDMMRRPFEEYLDHTRRLMALLKQHKFEGQLVWMTAPVRHYKAFLGHPGICTCPEGRPSNCTAEPERCTCDCSYGNSWYQEVPGGDLSQAMQNNVGDLAHEITDAPIHWTLPGRGPARSGVGLPLFSNTYSRVRHGNKKALEIVREAYPNVKVLDFQGITDGLPPDFCFDGLHYGCWPNYFTERLRQPWRCRNIANRVVANVLSNMLCSDSS